MFNSQAHTYVYLRTYTLRHVNVLTLTNMHLHIRKGNSIYEHTSVGIVERIGFFSTDKATSL